MNALLGAVLLHSLLISPAQQGSMAASSPEMAKPISVGMKAPDAMLRTVEGKDTTLKEVIKGKKTVLIFYRGGWCPFCNRHLAEVAQVEGDLHNMGYQVIGISPDQPEKLKAMIDKNKLNYKLFSDSKAESLKAFGVAYRIDEETFNTYKDKYNLNLEEWSGQNHHILPVPSVFILDKGGVIRFVHSNPDYKVRIKTADLLAAAKKAAM